MVLPNLVVRILMFVAEKELALKHSLSLKELLVTSFWSVDLVSLATFRQTPVVLLLFTLNAPATLIVLWDLSASVHLSVDLKLARLLVQAIYNQLQPQITAENRFL